MNRSRMERITDVPALPPENQGNYKHVYDEVQKPAAELRDLRLHRPVFPPQENARESALKAICSIRSLRFKFLPIQLFADPAWDMLLELKQAELRRTRMTVTKLCISSEVPSTTALRWIEILMINGMVVKSDDPLDGRRKFVALNPDTSTAMDRFLDEANQHMHACSSNPS